MDRMKKLGFVLFAIALLLTAGILVHRHDQTERAAAAEQLKLDHLRAEQEIAVLEVQKATVDAQLAQRAGRKVDESARRAALQHLSRASFELEFEQQLSAIQQQ
jgi:hypothetical protein